MQALRISRLAVPELALLGASVLWGASFLATKIGMEYTGPLSFVALRYLMATVVFALVLPRATRGINWTELIAGIVVAATACIAYGAQAYALQTTDTARRGLSFGALRSSRSRASTIAAAPASFTRHLDGRRAGLYRRHNHVGIVAGRPRARSWRCAFDRRCGRHRVRSRHPRIFRPAG